MKNETKSRIKITIPDVSVQFGLGSAVDGGKLTNLWMETTKPEHCNLACRYCYAKGGEKQKEALTTDQWLSILEQAKILGITSIGIPGAGEPFHPSARDRTMQILEKCGDLGIYTTLFTTGEFITEGLADRLHQFPVELMIKGNSLVPEIQDNFVSDSARGRIIKGYGVSRNNALELLIKKGFNDERRCLEQFKRKSRMALVTFVMTDEVTESQAHPVSPEEIRTFVGLLQQYANLGIGKSYKRALDEASGIELEGTSNFREIAYLMAFARVNNIIFDVDSVLQRGRGASCKLNPADERMKAKFKELQVIDNEVFGYEWGVNTTYVGVACERPRRHLYINYTGEIRPCIGATGVILGNIQNISLTQAWESSEMKILRAKSYHGKCADQCANFKDLDPRTGKPLCNSCLGRCTEDLTNESLLKKGYVQTIGCWNFRERDGESKK